MSAETYLLDLTIAKPLVTFSRRGQRIDYWRWRVNESEQCRQPLYETWLWRLERGVQRRGTGSLAGVLLLPLFSNGKDLTVFSFCREEANGEEDNKKVENRRETGQSQFLEEIGEVAVQLTDQPWLEGPHHQSTADTDRCVHGSSDCQSFSWEMLNKIVHRKWGNWSGDGNMGRVREGWRKC